MNRELAETLLAQLIADELDPAARAELLAYLKTDAEFSETLGDMRMASGLLHEGLNAGDPPALRSDQRAVLDALIKSEPHAIAPHDKHGQQEAPDSDAADAEAGNETPAVLFTLRGAGAAAACLAIGVGTIGLLTQTPMDIPDAANFDSSNESLYTPLNELSTKTVDLPNADRAPRPQPSAPARPSVISIITDESESGDWAGSIVWNDNHVDFEQRGTVNTPYGSVTPDPDAPASGLLALADSSGRNNGGGGGGRGGGGGEGLFDDAERTEGEVAEGRYDDIWLASNGVDTNGEWPHLANLTGRYVDGTRADDLSDSDIFSFSVDLPFDSPDDMAAQPEPLPHLTRAPGFDLDDGLFTMQRDSGGFNHSAQVNPGYQLSQQGQTNPDGWLADPISESEAALALGRELADSEPGYRYADGQARDEFGTDQDIAFNSANTDTLLNIDTDGDGVPDATDGLPDNGSQWHPLTITGNSASDVDSAGPPMDRSLAQVHEEIGRLQSQLAQAEAESRRGSSDLVTQARTQMAGDKVAEAAEAMANGQVNLGAQLYEEALLLDPENADLQARLTDARNATNDSLRPATPIAGAAQDRTIARQDSTARYEAEMARAAEALTAGNYDAATDATNEARIALNASRSNFAQPEYNEMQARAARMNAEVNSTRQRADASAHASAERIRTQDERHAAVEADNSQREEVMRLLHTARERQLGRDYDGALQALDAAEFLDPDNPAVPALRGIIQDVSVSLEVRSLKRDLDLMRSNQQLVNDEAIIPYDELLTYPGDWPQLTQMRLEDVDAQLEAYRENTRNIENLEVERAVLREQIEAIQQQSINAEISESTDRLRNQVNRLSEMAVALDIELSEAQAVNNALTMRLGSSDIADGTNAAPASPINGFVTAVEDIGGDITLVELNVGERDAIEPGMQITISRGDEYVGVVLVQAVDETTCIGQIVRLSGESIFIGDRATASRTRLSGTDEANRTAELALRRVISSEFEDVKLGDVIDYIRDTTGANIAVNWPALELSGIDQDTPISLTLSRVPAEQMLRLAIEQAGANVFGDDKPGYVIVEGILNVTTLADLKPATDSRVYDIRDLLTDERFPGMTRGQAIDQLLQQIQQSIGDANEWLDEESTVRELNGNFIIKSTPENHRAILAMLNAMRGEAAAEEAQPPTPPANYPVNPWVLTQDDALSTFAVDVDTASYQLARRHIVERGQLPAASSIRMEEFVNRFDYNYPAGHDAAETFRVHLEAGPAPFADEGIALVKVGIRGRVVARDQQKPAHLVFVIDASGSMAREDRLPLVQRSLAIVLEQLGDQDTVTLVSYDTEPYLLVEHASASDPQAILDAAASIQTRGSTNLIDGMRLGYQVAARHFVPGNVNRVILCSDGVANVGSDDADGMLQAVAQYREHGITLTTLGVGIDELGQAGSGLNDHLLEQLANRGDGRYLYLGSIWDAHRLLATELSATAPIIARDVKIQVAFDPERVRRYRLIGYENRAIADADFRNDSVDAGEVFSGQSATALYEVELHPPRNQAPGNQGGRTIVNGQQAELGQVFIRYHDTRTDQVEETQCTLHAELLREKTPHQDPRFFLAACAAEFAERLRESEHGPGMGPGVGSGSDDALMQLISEVAEQLPLDSDVAELKELIDQSRGLPRAQ